MERAVATVRRSPTNCSVRIVAGMKLALIHLIRYEPVILQYPPEKRMEFEHLNLAVYNIAASNCLANAC